MLKIINKLQKIYLPNKQTNFLCNKKIKTNLNVLSNITLYWILMIFLKKLWIIKNNFVLLKHII